MEAFVWDYAADLLFVTVAASGAAPAELKEAIEQLGFRPRRVEAEDAPPAPERTGEAPSTGEGPSGEPAPPSAPDVPVLTRWLTAAQQAEREVLLLVFVADWCAPCKRLTDETLTDDKVRKRLATHADVHIVDTVEEPHLPRHFDVVAVPELRFLDATRGTVRAAARGYQAPQEVLALLEKALAQAPPEDAEQGE